MKPVVFSLLLAALCITTPLASQDCGRQRDEYRAKSRALIGGVNVQAENSPQEEERLTDVVHEYLKGRILEMLDAKPSAHASDISKYVECVQEGVEYQDTKYMTNLPAAWEVPGAHRSLLVAFWIYRGYSAVPNMRPYLEAYKRVDNRWTADSEVGSEFSGFTFNIRQISAGKPGEAWFLLWGSRVGQQPRSEQRMSVAAYDGSSLREIWSRSGISAMTVEGVYPDHIVLSGESTSAQGRAEEIRERFDIVPQGLKLSKHEVTKSY